ncbi:MAG: arsenate reductase (azurin) small subunit [Pseudomonadota bacterium]
MSNVDPKVAAAINGASGEAERAGTRKCLMNRRQFLLTGGIATTVVMVGVPGMPHAQTPAAVSTYPRKLIGQLSALNLDEPVDFEYPDEGLYAESILVKLGQPAGGGLGPQRDVVAFNYTCTHQGGALQGTYQAADKALGPCPLHLTTFDLTRHGIFISGQAYQSLPQVLLELEGDDIYAVGMFGLIYGRFDNLMA